MITLSTLKDYKKQNIKFSCLTCYDATFAQTMQKAQIDCILVGDSLGMVIQGKNSTVPVTVQDVAYHTQAVAAGNSHALIMADMPFMSYATIEKACQSAQILMQAGAHLVKIEGGAWLKDTISTLTQNGTPVCAHLGLTPQFVNILGGYKLQGKTQQAAAQLIQDCKTLTQAGASLILLECVPKQLAALVQQQIDVPVIGIGAGVDCDGQVLVMHDMLGLQHGKPARFVKNFLEGQNSIEAAFNAFHQAVRAQRYPSAEHSFSVEII